jgi:hypothetical protein
MCTEKTIIYCAVDTRLFVWTTIRGASGDIQVDKVISYANKAGRDGGSAGSILSFWPVFSEAYSSGQPVIYLGSTSGCVHLNIPTDRLVYAVDGTQARRYKEYSFRGLGSAISCMAVLDGKIYCGSRSGWVGCWKEPMNMLKLRTKAVHQAPATRPTSVANLNRRYWQGFGF